jgi:hypothetical protein
VHLVLSLLLTSSSLVPATVDQSPDYQVELTGNASGTSWSGRETVAFTNTSSVVLPEIYLRAWGNVHDCSAVKVSIGVTDCTVVKVPLPSPLKPGQRTSVSFDVSMTAPNREDHFGRSGAFSFFGNALPVLAVHDADGWHLDPDVGIGESFYTVAADFTVQFHHPTGLGVPSTGTTTDGVTIAKQVRDFAWAAGPFATSELTSPGGVKIRTWSTPSVDATGLGAEAAAAVDDFGRRFGTYPYGELDLVVNDRWTSFSGMEYPGFVLLIAPESPVVHEVAHQWWYGIVGNDEYADPWLDEAFATYASDVHAGDHRPGCWPGSLPTAITRDMGYWGAHQTSYGVYVYTYGSCALHELERVIGGPAMARMLAAYAKAHWYGVSTPADFRAAAQAAGVPASFWSSHGLS